jgi:hypothetical protein
MKGVSSNILVIVVALGIMFLIGLLYSEGGQRSSKVELGSPGAPDVARPPSDRLAVEPLETPEGPSDGSRVALLEPAPPPETEAWARAAPTLEIHTMTGREILAAYWGEEWPEVEAHLGERLALVDAYWAGPDEELGRPEDVLNGIVQELLDDLDGVDGSGGPPRRIASMCAASPSPYRSTGAFRDVLERARAISGTSSSHDAMLSVARRQYYESEVGRVCAGVEDEWVVLDECVRSLIVAQLSRVDRFTQPDLGHLTICPLLNFGPPPHVAQSLSASGRSRWFVPFAALARDRMRCKFIAQWCVDLRDDPGCAVAIEAITAAEAEAESELESLTLRMAAEIR